jgi:cytochrome c-type biogenesis protein
MGGVSAGAALLAGRVACASPCFLPVVPVWVAYMTGLRVSPAVAAPGRDTPAQAGPAKAPVGLLAPPAPAARRSRTALACAHALVFMAGFTAVFMAVWGLVALVGWAAADYRSWLRVAGGALLIVFGLNRAGWINLAAFARQRGPAYRPDPAQAPTFRRSVLLGLAFGAGWTPCIGPILGAVLGLATVQATLGAGMGLMAVFALGLGLPFVAVTAGADVIVARLKWLTRHHRAVDVATGLALVAAGFGLVSGLWERLAGLFPALV